MPNWFVVIFFLSEQKKSTFGRSIWPLHLTIIGTFSTEKSAKEISKKLDAVQKRSPIHLVGEKREMLGYNHDIPVTVLKRTDAIQKLHLDVLDTLGRDIVSKSPEWNGDGYNPHITDTPQHSVALGEKVSVDSFSLVQLEKEKACIIKTWNLR